MVFRPVKTALEIAHHNGLQSPASEKIRALADDAITAFELPEAISKLREVATDFFNFTVERTYETLCELIAKISDFAGSVFKCGEFLAVKGVAMWDSKLLETWGNRANSVFFGWEIFKNVRLLAKENPDPAQERANNLSLISLVFNTSIFALVALGSVLSPTAILCFSSSALIASIGREFYEKLTPTVHAGTTHPQAC